MGDPKTPGTKPNGKNALIARVVADYHQSIDLLHSDKIRAFGGIAPPDRQVWRGAANYGSDSAGQSGEKPPKGGDPSESSPIDTRHPMPMTPEMEKYLRPTQAPQIIFDPKTGKPAIKGTLPPDSANPSDITPKSDILRRYGWRMPVPKDMARDMLNKDKRLDNVDESDKDAIAEAVSARNGEVGQNGKTPGDIVREEVEKYLANKGNVPKTTLQIDPEAAVRILREFCSDMALLERMKKEGWLSPFLDESNPIEINGWLIPAFRTVQIYWHTEAEVLESVRVIPKSLLDDPAPGGMTVRELLKEAANYPVFESVNRAISEKLN